MAGVKYDAHYNYTTVDPPELVYFVRSFPDVKMESAHYKDGTRVTMWNLIERHTMPPTRLARYCCAYLKENNEHSKGRFVITGVRWDESVKRKNTRGGSRSAAKRQGSANILTQTTMMKRRCITACRNSNGSSTR